MVLWFKISIAPYFPLYMCSVYILMWCQNKTYEFALTLTTLPAMHTFPKVSPSTTRDDKMNAVLGVSSRGRANSLRDPEYRLNCKPAKSSNGSENRKHYMVCKKLARYIQLGRSACRCPRAHGTFVWRDIKCRSSSLSCACPIWA